MSEQPLKVGDLVLPIEFREYEAAFKNYNLRVTHVFKSGNVRAKTDSGNARWNGPADSFYRPIHTADN